MRRELLILLAAVTFSVAMVPRLRRAVNLDDDVTFEMSKSTQPGGQICQPRTPCAWSVFKSNTRIIDSRIVNTYCSCTPGTTCQEDPGEDPTNGVLVHHCKTPSTEDTTES